MLLVWVHYVQHEELNPSVVSCCCSMQTESMERMPSFLSQGQETLHGGATDGKGGPVEWLWGNWFVNIPVRISSLLWKAILELVSMKQKHLPLNVILSTSQTAFKQVTQLSNLQKGPGFSLDNGIFLCAKEDLSMTLHSTCDFSWWKKKSISLVSLSRDVNYGPTQQCKLKKLGHPPMSQDSL